MICTIIDCAPAMATTPQSGAKLSETGMQLSVPDPSGSLMDALLNMQALLADGMQYGDGDLWVGLLSFIVLFLGLFFLQRLAGVRSELQSMQGMLITLGENRALTMIKYIILYCLTHTLSTHTYTGRHNLFSCIYIYVDG